MRWYKPHRKKRRHNMNIQGGLVQLFAFQDRFIFLRSTRKRIIALNNTNIYNIRDAGIDSS